MGFQRLPLWSLGDGGVVLERSHDQSLYLSLFQLTS